jgi:predicted RNA methylase
MKYIYVLAGDDNDRELAVAEAEALTGGCGCSPKLFEADRLIDIAASGFISAGIELLAAGPDAPAVRAQLTEQGVASDDFAISVRKLPGGLKVKRNEIATELVLGVEGNPDLRNPKEVFLALVTPGGIWFGRELPAAVPEWRAFEHKPHPFSSALASQTARAVCNLFVRGGERVIDPCCGSGSLLIHSAALGATVFGSDINQKMVGSTTKNLAHFGFSGEITRQDAAEARGEYDVMLANVPYNMMSPIADEQLSAIVRNIVTLAPRGAIVSAQDVTSDIEAGGGVVDRIIHQRKFSMTRLIFCYSRPASSGSMIS